MMSYRRHNVASTLVRRRFYDMYPLGAEPSIRHYPESETLVENVVLHDYKLEWYDRDRQSKGGDISVLLRLNSRAPVRVSKRSEG